MPWKKSIKYNQHEQYEDVDQSSWGQEELERGITEENERMIWNRCSVCNHPLRDEIENAWLKKGRNAYMSVRQLSKNYGMSPTSIDRHMSRHVWVDLETREKITDEEYSSLTVVPNNVLQ